MEKALAISMNCDVCQTVYRIYGTTESVAPWLCQCPAPRQSPLPETRIWRPANGRRQSSCGGGATPARGEACVQTLFFAKKKRISFGRLLTPKISAAMRKRWLDAQISNNE